MHIEVQSAANFFVHLIRLGRHGAQLGDEQLNSLRQAMCNALTQHYTGHWYPSKPSRGSGYRCIRINNGRLDPLLLVACHNSYVQADLVSNSFPAELTLWINPSEVSYRIGDNGSISHLYSKPSGTCNDTCDIDQSSLDSDLELQADCPWMPGTGNFSDSPFRSRARRITASSSDGSTCMSPDASYTRGPNRRRLADSSKKYMRQRTSDSTGNSLSTSPASHHSSDLQHGGHSSSSESSSGLSSSASSPSPSPVPLYGEPQVVTCRPRSDESQVLQARAEPIAAFV